MATWFRKFVKGGYHYLDPLFCELIRRHRGTQIYFPLRNEFWEKMISIFYTFFTLTYFASSAQVTTEVSPHFLGFDTRIKFQSYGSFIFVSFFFCLSYKLLWFWIIKLKRKSRFHLLSLTDKEKSWHLTPRGSRLFFFVFDSMPQV